MAFTCLGVFFGPQHCPPPSLLEFFARQEMKTWFEWTALCQILGVFQSFVLAQLAFLEGDSLFPLCFVGWLEDLSKINGDTGMLSLGRAAAWHCVGSLSPPSSAKIEQTVACSFHPGCGWQWMQKEHWLWGWLLQKGGSSCQELTVAEWRGSLSFYSDTYLSIISW